MEMTPTVFIAGLTFMVLWTASILGLAAYITRQFSELRRDFDGKHKENGERYDRLNTLVTRHDTILNRQGRHRG